MRLSFYSGLGLVAVMAADTIKALKLEDDEANYLAEINDSEPAEQDWNLSQSMS